MATATPRPRAGRDSSLDIDSPPTLMGMMMSSTDLPSTLTSTPRKHENSTRTTTLPIPVTPPRNINRTKPTLTATTTPYHSDLDPDQEDTTDSIVSTAVDAPATRTTSLPTPEPAPLTGPKTPARRTNPKEHFTFKEEITPEHCETDEFVTITHPSPSPNPHGGRLRDHDRSPEGSPPQMHQRGRLGHIVSISGIKRSLSQTDLRGVRRPSRIKAAVSRLSRNWGREKGEGVKGEERA
ncbi:hypothetical protein QBC34DRAFT_164525 [Podospora aff. communis PSN243]|uniref:Uncharacterized protein n=1 Tax=Podospora aff. communis PSN243 TaxID=3040156 RepID=A0AAV9GAX1_9PEZI|nr:hypothetical protein QBC34DRAFT_164525 [Podospora aff. communis PSN243]